MTQTEKTIGLLLVLSILLIFSHISFGALILVLSISALAFYYLFFARCIFSGVRLKQRFQAAAFADQPKLVARLSAASGLAIAATCLASLFRIHHWHGAFRLYLFSAALCFLLLIVTTLVQLKEENRVYQAMSWRLALFLVLGMLAWLGI